MKSYYKAPWKVAPCFVVKKGGQCWCSVIEAESGEPIINAGELHTEIAQHVVGLHNQYLQGGYYYRHNTGCEFIEQCLNSKWLLHKIDYENTLDREDYCAITEKEINIGTKDYQRKEQYDVISCVCFHKEYLEKLIEWHNKYIGENK